ncbi:MAG: hypothetical protein Q9165_002549 [Trypethelium subeluteriae]
MDQLNADRPDLDSTGAPVYTYHCLCKQLILASTQSLDSLPIRTSCIEKPYILRLPDKLPSSEDSGPEDNGLNDEQEPSEQQGDNPFKARGVQHFALLFSTIVSPKAQVVRKTSGFEKRYLRYCSRCKLPIGYQLDWCMFADEEGQQVTEANGQQWKKTGRRMDYIYLFPGGMIDTKTMDETCDGGIPVGTLQTRESGKE